MWLTSGFKELFYSQVLAGVMSLSAVLFSWSAAHAKQMSADEIKGLDRSGLSAWSAQCIVDMRSAVHILQKNDWNFDDYTLGGFYTALIVFERATDVKKSTIDDLVNDQIRKIGNNLSLLDDKSKSLENCTSNAIYVALRVYERPVTSSENKGNEGNPEKDKQPGTDVIYNYFYRTCLSGLTVLDDKNSISLNSKDVFCNCVSLRMKSDSAERPSFYKNLILSDDKSKLGELMESQWDACLSDLR